VIFEKLLNFSYTSIFFEVLVHLGTLIAIFIVFHKEIVNLFKALAEWFKNGFKKSGMNEEHKSDLRLVFLIIAATIPTGLIGILFKDKIEEIFHSVRLVGFALIVTGLILFSTRFYSKGSKTMRQAGWFDAVLIGIFQGIAVIPGISRSGITISTGLLRNISREQAAKFSFFISIPAVLGASIIKALDLEAVDLKTFPVLLPGFFASIISGVFAIKILLRHLAGGKFYLYSAWCFAIGLVTIIFLS
jgi:undecaprenyl-diphosphatase